MGNVFWRHQSKDRPILSNATLLTCYDGIAPSPVVTALNEAEE